MFLGRAFKRAESAESASKASGRCSLYQKFSYASVKRLRLSEPEPFVPPLSARICVVLRVFRFADYDYCKLRVGTRRRLKHIGKHSRLRLGLSRTYIEQNIEVRASHLRSICLPVILGPSAIFGSPPITCSPAILPCSG